MNDMPSYTIHTLPNGLRVVLAPRQDTQAITVAGFVKTGSRYEAPAVYGVSHFLEHLLFKGTKRRPSTMALSKLLDQVGAEYNAYTARDHTYYYIKVSSDHLDLAVDVLSDMLWHSLIASKEVDKERGVIVEEINMYEDNPMFYVEELMERELYGEQHPLGHPITGPREVIRTVPRSSIWDYYRQHYFAGNMVFGIAGRFEENSALRLLRKMEPARGGKAMNQPRAGDPAWSPKPSPRIAIKFKQSEQVQVSLGFAGLAHSHPDYQAMQVLSTILGGSMTSRLFMSVREKLGLAYVVRSSITGYEDSGVFSVQAGLDKARIEQAVAAIGAELRKLQRTLVPASELRRAKDFLRGKLILEFEDSAEIAGWYTRQVLLGRPVVTPEQRIAQWQAVTAAKLRELARQTFQVRQSALAVIGPYDSDGVFRKAMADGIKN